MKIRILVVATTLFAGVAFAGESRVPPVGAETRAWLDLQARGTQASPVERPLPGEIAERSYQRYVKSFEQPIPATFDREQFVSGSGGSSR